MGSSAKFRLVLASAAALLLAACGGGGSGSDDDADRYMPLAVGNSWTYEVRLHARDPELASVYGQRWEATATTRLAGADGVVIGTRDLDSGMEGSIALAANRGVLLRQYDPNWNGELASVGPTTILRLPSVNREAQVVDDRKGVDVGLDWDLDGVNESMAVKTVLVSEGREAVEVAAGRFDDALRVRATTTITYTYSAAGATNTSQWRDTYWFAEGVGIVRSQLASVDGNYEYRELMAYVVDGVRGGDATPPTSVSTTPPDGMQVEGDTSVDIQFGESMDFTRAALQLLDADGNSVPGYYMVEHDRMTLVPDFLLPDGRYTAQLSAATDLSGNAPAGPVTWSFTVETIRPVIVSRDPAPNAVDVPVDAELTITFSRALDPLWVDSSTIWLQDDNFGSLFATLQLSEDGTRVTITPDFPLNSSAIHTVGVEGWLQDLEGNQLGESMTWQFTTAIEGARLAGGTEAQGLTPQQKKMQGKDGIRRSRK